MPKTSLNRRVRALIADFGKKQVLEAIGSINSGDALPIDGEHSRARQQRRFNRKQVNGSSSAALQVDRQIRSACENRPAAMARLSQLATMYQAREFLGKLYDVTCFLQKHGEFSTVRSRPSALKYVIATLAKMSDAQLEGVVKSAVERHEVGDYMLLANAIMGKPSKTRH